MSPSQPPVGQLVERLARRVRSVLEGAGLGGASLVVGVSGGADSLCLLHVLKSLESPLGLSLHVAHLDHGLREGSEADASFVAEEARRLGLPCTVERASITPAARRGASPEEAARKVRYAFLGRVAQEAGAAGVAGVALGHTADDQAETVLLHLIRGSGLPGLRGMQPLSAYRTAQGATVTLVRPLLGVTRQETEAFCHLLGLSRRQDATNLQPQFTRNRLRLEVLPMLRQINPSIRDGLLRLSRAVALDMTFLEGEVERAWPGVAQVTAAGVSLDRQALGGLHPALQHHLLRRAFAELAGSTEDLAQCHLVEMARLLAPGPSGRSLHLPAGVRLAVDYSRLWLTRGEGDACPLPPLQEGVLACPGETRLGGWLVEAAVVTPPPAVMPGDPWVAFLDLDALGGDLHIRPRRPGDRFQPLGMQDAVGATERQKKLQDFMVDARIPRLWRPRIPLLVTPRGIAWVVGWRIAHWARIAPETHRALRMRFRQLS
ncbi:MAG: tRNA lysidine(34) synthetase TilS [Chloroflexi bacterium]|nr:tRNA lysidine(34) synthetase TilS [Chloroflexota bacterium]